MSNVERVLWRIAELGARCTQHSSTGGRGPLWAELEETIAGLEAEFEAAREAVDLAPAQVRSLEGRLTVARQERDREKARADENQADAAAARRERDREHQKARKAMSMANEAKADATEARATAAECMARVAAAEAATDQALAARDQALCAFDEAAADGERAEAILSDTRRAFRAATVRIAELEAALDATRAERDAAVAAQATAAAARDEAVDTLAAQADSAVVVLPGVALAEPTAAPAPPAPRVSWRPTWSEWAQADEEEESAVVFDEVADRADMTDDMDPAQAWTVEAGTDEAGTVEAETVEVVVDRNEEVVLDEPVEDGTRRYLNVSATTWQLLPEDLGPLLLAGATVIRREGRLCATVAITTKGVQQAQKLADAGFRVEWTSDAPLAC
jgi:hypothetical protein